jgi:hypothetical protein
MTIIFRHIWNLNIELVSEILSEWHQPILYCCYKWLVAKYQTATYSRLSTFWALTLALAHDTLMTCEETRPHFKKLYLAFHFRRQTRKTEYLFANSLQTLFTDNICWCVQAFREYDVNRTDSRWRPMTGSDRRISGNVVALIPRVT